ncbi:hypothetical protein F4860DRAFT_494685 [Xylaria cubensis]|nr:hypothetical protein F4860DRAFT_494685 [Xylaria cubensis]
MAAPLPNPVEPLLGQQPDFTIVTDSLQAITTEVGYISNMGEVHHANMLAQIDQRIIAMAAEIATLTTTMTTNITTLNRTVNNLDANLRRRIQNEGASIKQTIQTLDFNTQARVYNSNSKTVTDSLRSLRNTTTQEIIQLPRTVQELNDLRKRDYDELLTQLGQDLTLPDTVGNRQMQLKQFIGMHP